MNGAGRVECPDAWAGYDTLTWGLSIATNVYRADTPAYWSGWNMVEQDGAFDLTQTFQQTGFVAWNPGEEIVVEQFFAGWGFVDVCGGLQPPPSGDITAATLQLETEPALAVEQSTWGRIKSLYR
ncbi:MAG TPA: hypothetical protein VFT13_13960 [Candidatus Krumholzibacteria bacterium]|nr:hypothetical protein [Candidatus Krumholzibacteria bacterium]